MKTNEVFIHTWKCWSVGGTEVGIYIITQDDEINLQCQLVEKLKQQMLDQDEVGTWKLTHTYKVSQPHTHTLYCENSVSLKQSLDKNKKGSVCLSLINTHDDPAPGLIPW